jgi:hypothetical protein
MEDPGRAGDMLEAKGLEVVLELWSKAGLFDGSLTRLNAVKQGFDSEPRYL